MSIYKKALIRLFKNYVVGSTVAVVGVGSPLMAMSLNISLRDLRLLFLIQFFSFMIMLAVEYKTFQRDMSPIRTLFSSFDRNEQHFYLALVQAKRFPLLAVRRIFIPHFLGLSVPAVVMTASLIYKGLLHIPYAYILYAWLGAFLVTSLHAVLEFFLTIQTMKPLIREIIRIGRRKGWSDAVEATNVVYVPIKVQLQLSVLFIGTFPIILFVLASQVKTTLTVTDFGWVFVVLCLSVAFSLFAAQVLSKEIESPIRDLHQSMRKVQKETFETICENIYIDEFSELTNGFNHMVKSILRREEKNQQLLDSFITVMTTALDARDTYTAGHSLRVATYSLEIGKRLRLPEEQLQKLYKSAILHDIGKIGIPDAILLKEGRLTDEEFAWIKRHPVLGETILRQVQPIEEIEDLLPGIRSHHERIDGNGYPDGLKGEAIPLFGRIIAVADAFDAMTSDRPYRKGMSVEKALAILQEGKGTQWDTEMVNHFIDYLKDEPSFSVVYPERVG
ncbi:HD-GYP domain-containing protein [Anoxybacteroides tepidamans]|uniref:HD-GYP domain-containing protein n=1 Tax=Anoxybacteroides tepidamans TaxID=265948 RepID=UPI000684796A|nr:HD-GYP domain-containing protein [Anoxybacillus tepidamans]